MREIDDALNTLIDTIKSTKEYNQYQTLLNKVKNEPELYGRICDYRRQSLALQLRIMKILFRKIMSAETFFGSAKYRAFK